MGMTMPSIRTAIALLGLVAASAGETRTVMPKAETIVAAAKRATGGSAWDTPQGCTERGTHADGAITYLTRFSLHDYGMRTDGDRGGHVRSVGFDGKARWRTDSAGKVDAGSDPMSLQEGIMTDYLSINGFFFPDRFPATFSYIRPAEENGRRFDIVEITPQGGRPLEVWFDSRTHLIQRVVDIQGAPAVRVEASDYRRGNDGLMVAYRLDTFGPDGAAIDHGVVISFQCGTIDRAIFAPPTAH